MRDRKGASFIGSASQRPSVAYSDPASNPYCVAVPSTRNSSSTPPTGSTSLATELNGAPVPPVILPTIVATAVPPRSASVLELCHEVGGDGRAPFLEGRGQGPDRSGRRDFLHGVLVATRERDGRDDRVGDVVGDHETGVTKQVHAEPPLIRVERPPGFHLAGREVGAAGLTAS